MIKSLSTPELGDILKGFNGEAATYHRIFDQVQRAFACKQVLLITTLPRGGTQVALPGHAPEPLVKAYHRQAYLHDRATWQAIMRRQPLMGEQCWSGSWAENPFFRDWMQPNGFRYLMAVPLAQPFLDGYAAALHFYRGEDQAPFTEADARAAGKFCEALNRAFEAKRQRDMEAAARAQQQDAPKSQKASQKAAQREGKKPAWNPRIFLSVGQQRQFVFDRAGHSSPIYQSQRDMDEELNRQLRQHAQQQLPSLNGQVVSATRVQLPDSHGRLWSFRAVMKREFPALANGPVAIYCFQPLPCEWYVLRPADFQADQEFMRLIPSLHFMREEFRRNPTLDEIALKAHLSPFHFHRRFSELMGQTPKHFLLDCQVQCASRLLFERAIPLAEIATRCGFAHQSHFTSRFKQATGLTPTRWRRVAAEQAEEAK